MLPHSIVHDESSAPPSYHSSTASSSQTSSPRTRPDSLAGSVILDLLETDTAPSRPSTDSQAYSDSYDSAGEGTSSLASSVRSRLGGLSVGSSKDLHAYGGGWSGDEGAARYFPGSTASSRANSPAPGGDGFDGYLSYRTTSRNRSRNGSGFSTPITPGDKEAHGADFYTQHHHQTSALLRKLGGSLGPEASPVLGRNSRKPGWWTRRAEARRKASISSSASGTPLLGSPALSRSASRNKSTFSAFISALLRQPWFPTQPISILFSLLLFGCFAATLTTFLVNVLSSDREPVPWRQYCQEQRPFPHALADSLKPVNVFVGVFTVDAAAERRNAIRLTYGKHSKPIDPRTGRPAHNVQLKFILGRPRKKWAKRIALEMEMFNDLVVLDVDENMNKGKTFKYFSWANENATVPVFYSTPGEEGLVDGVRQVGVGFRKADYVVKADDDTFIDLSELERHLRITPRENTYWGYLIRNRFMGGELYALSSDLVNHLTTYERPKSWTIGKEDQRVAKWMHNHPNVSAIHWITERCYIYDHAKAGTPYARGFTFPDHVEQVRLEGRRGISEEERLRRGGELWQSYSTVTTWKKPYVEPASGLSMEEQVEALVEGGGRWAAQGWRSDNGRGPEAVKLEKVVFPQGDKRIFDPVLDRAGLADHPDTTATGAKPGAPDRSVVIPSARTTRFGKDLYRDPEGVEAVNHLRKRDPAVAMAANVQEGPTRGPLAEGEHEIHNLVKGPFEDDVFPTEHAASSSAVAGNSSSSSSPLSPPPPFQQSATGQQPPAYVNEPTAQIRIGQHAYALPSYNERFIPAPTLRYDPTSLSIRKQRMLGLPYGGTVAVHYLKRNEWFFETALAILGRERMWDNGVDVPAYPLSPYSTNSLLEPYAKDPLAVSTRPLNAHSASTHRSGGEEEDVVVAEAYPALWGGPRMYGSPIVLEDGMIVEGRRAEANREVVDSRTAAAAKVVKNEPVEGATWKGRTGRFGAGAGAGKPLVAVAEMEGVSIEVGGGEEETSPADQETASSVEEIVSPSSPSSSDGASSSSSTSDLVSSELGSSPSSPSSSPASSPDPSSSSSSVTSSTTSTATQPIATHLRNPPYPAASPSPAPLHTL